VADEYVATPHQDVASGQLYQEFVARKVKLARRHGFEPNLESIHPSTFPHQLDGILWAARLGRALISMSFGLGKSSIQLQLARLVHEHTGGQFLIICPLGVKHQFIEEDGPRLGLRCQYVRTDAEVEAADTPFLITNYERVRDGNIDPRRHNITGVSLDEGSVLRSLGSKTYQTFQELFKDTPYRFVATATPAPNQYRELIYYAQFLGIMDAGQALTRWFKRDSLKAGNLTLHPHHEKDFWLWVASWAMFLYTPGDLGHSDEGYDLPPINVHWHRLPVDHSRAWGSTDNRGQHKMLLDAGGSIQDAAREKRTTLPARIAKMQEILADNPGKHWLLWHHLEDERRAIELAVPEAVSVYGSQDLEVREDRILQFSRGQIPFLSSKPELVGSGCNFQRFCHDNIFLGVDYRFEDFIQAIHRTQRFGQPHPVNVHIIYSESEDHVVEVLKEKWQRHNELTETMRGIIRKYGLSHAAMKQELTRQIGVERREVRGKWFTAINNDCVLELLRILANSIGLVLTSIPFGNHYEYSTQYEDYGHNPSDEEFFAQMSFLIKELFRVLQPGRIAAIHVKDRILYGHQTASGFLELNPFSDKVIAAFRAHGFLFQSRRTLMTDVVRENNQTYRLGWSEVCKDSSKMGSGSPEYLLTFRKPPSESANAYADAPITKSKAAYTRGRWQLDAHSLWRSAGNTLLTPDELAMLPPQDVARIFAEEQLQGPYNYERHVAICEALDSRGRLPASFMLLPPRVTHEDDDAVWDDITYMHSLNAAQSQARRENHVCPLPFDIVERAIRLYSNEGDVVLDPFAGLHTVPYMAVKMGRYGHGVELNGEYWEAGVKYCRDAEIEATTPTLFDLLALEEASGVAV
jgi:DNA modification methylase